MAADDALIKALRESYGRFCSNESFITVDEMCCNLRYLTYMNRI